MRSGQRGDRRLFSVITFLIGASAFSPDGATIMLACEDGNVRLYDAANGTLMTATPTGLTNPTVTSFSPDGTRFLVGSEEGKAIAFAF